MYYMNTNPDLLGKNMFQVSKIITTKKLFKENLRSIIKEIGDLNPKYLYETSEWKTTSEEALLVHEINNFIVNELHYTKWAIPKRLESLVQLFQDDYWSIKNGVLLEYCDVSLVQEEYDVDFDEEYLDDCNTLKIVGAFPYFQTFTASNDCASCVVCSILYFDNEENLNIYIPTYGNTIVPDLGLSVADGFDTYDGEKIMDYFADLAKAYGKPITTFEGKDVSKLDDFAKKQIAAFEEYKSRYGIVKVRHNPRTPEKDYEYEGLMTDFFLVSKKRIKEDIASNII